MANAIIQTRARVGGASYSAAAVEYDPQTNTGTPGTAAMPEPGDFLPATGNTLKPMQAFAEEAVMTENLYSDAIMEPTILTAEGQEEWSVSPRLGNNRFKGVLSGSLDFPSTSVSAGSSVTVNGITTLAGATVAGLPGMPVVVNDGGSGAEGAVIIEDTGSDLIVALSPDSKIANVAASMTVTRRAMTQYAHSLLTKPAYFQAVLLSYHLGVGGEFDWVFPSCLLDGLDITFDKGFLKASSKIYGTAEPYPLDATTDPIAPSYNPSVQDEEIALRPFTAQNAVIAVAGDPEGTGTATVRAAVGLKTAKVGIDGILQKEQTLGSATMLALRGDKPKLSITYDEIDTAHRPAIFEEYVRLGRGASAAFSAHKNYGTKADPNIRGVCFYVPFAKFDKSGLSMKPGQTVDWTNEARGKREPGVSVELLQVYVVSD